MRALPNYNEILALSVIIGAQLLIITYLATHNTRFVKHVRGVLIIHIVELRK